MAWLSSVKALSSWACPPLSGDLTFLSFSVGHCQMQNFFHSAHLRKKIPNFLSVTRATFFPPQSALCDVRLSIRPSLCLLCLPGTRHAKNIPSWPSQRSIFKTFMQKIASVVTFFPQFNSTFHVQLTCVCSVFSFKIKIKI